MSGYEGDLSPEQNAALTEMKQVLSTVLTTPTAQVMTTKFNGVDACLLEIQK